MTGLASHISGLFHWGVCSTQSPFGSYSRNLFAFIHDAENETCAGLSTAALG